MVEPLPESASPSLTPTTVQAIEAVTAVAHSAKSAVVKADAEAAEAEASALATQLAKGKTPADRMKAADDLRKLGSKAKSATGAICQALFDPSPQVQVTALDALKGVNPKVHAPVATLVAPLTEADFLFMGSSDRPKAVAALAKLVADGQGALPVLLRYKVAISKPGGWMQVPEVLAAIIKVAPDDPAVATLLAQSLARDEYGPARATAAVGLSYTKPTKLSVGALGQAVRGDPEPEVRLAAVNTLAAFGAEAKAVEKIVEAAKTDPDMRVREAARKAAEKIK